MRRGLCVLLGQLTSAWASSPPWRSTDKRRMALRLGLTRGERERGEESLVTDFVHDLGCVNLNLRLLKILELGKAG